VDAWEREQARLHTDAQRILNELKDALAIALDEPPPARSLEELPPELLQAPLSASDLAALLKQPLPRVESFLRRYRERNPGCAMYIEDRDSRRRNEPLHRYRVAEVWPALQQQLEKWKNMNRKTNAAATQDDGRID
jgi:hypothetical protein